MERKRHNYIPLATRVLTVAVSHYREDGKLRDWAAYVDAVLGDNHEIEYMRVADLGTKLPKEVAFVLFPHIDKTKWRA